MFGTAPKDDDDDDDGGVPFCSSVASKGGSAEDAVFLEPLDAVFLAFVWSGSFDSAVFFRGLGPGLCRSGAMSPLAVPSPCEFAVGPVCGEEGCEPVFACSELLWFAFVLLRDLITSVFSDIGRERPWSLRKRPQALHRIWPNSLRRQSGVVLVWQLWHHGAVPDDEMLKVAFLPSLGGALAPPLEVLEVLLEDNGGGGCCGCEVEREVGGLAWG